MTKTVGISIAAVVAVIAIFLVVSYNGLVKKDQKINLTWGEVQNVYQRRLDLIPALVSTAKGVAEFEQTTLIKIAEARAKSASVITSDNYNEQTKSQDEVALATNRLIANIENYPTLQGTRAFKNLQTDLEGTERRIKFARKDFNEAIADYNSKVRSFPTSIAASLFSFPVKNGFTSETGADKAVTINFK